MQEPPCDVVNTTETVAQPDIKGLTKGPAAENSGNVTVLVARQPLSEEDLTNIAHQTERFAAYTPAPPLAPPVTLRKQARTSFLSPTKIRTMEREWRTAYHRAEGKAVRVHHFSTVDFVEASHILQHIRGIWRLPAALVRGPVLKRDAGHDAGLALNTGYIVPFYRVAKPNSRHATPPTLEGFEAVLSPYGR